MTNETRLIAVLTAVQFCNILDFVLMMPLGPNLMRTLHIDAQAFAWLVSSYNFSACISGLIGALVLDRFDRRTALLTLFFGFGLSTFACALAHSFPLLLAARISAGAFGGVLGALVFAIIGDAIPYQRRGAAMGAVMSAFSIASVLGVPAGVYLAAQADWEAPFFVLAGVCAVVFVVSVALVPSMRGHLNSSQAAAPLRTLLSVVNDRQRLRALAFSAVLMIAGFSVIPFISPYLFANVGISEAHLGLGYLCGGLVTVFTSPLIGKMSDRIGKHRVFLGMSAVSIAPLLVLTHLPVVPLWLAVLVMTVFIAFVGGRLVPAFTMITAAVPAQLRGSFMSVNSSGQALFSALAALLSGMIIVQPPGQPMQHFGLVGWLAVGFTVVGIALSFGLRPAEQASTVVAPR